METYLAVDIGTTSIKVVEKDANEQVVKWGILERRKKPFHSTISPVDEEDASKHLKILINRMNSDAKRAVAAIPPFLAFTAIAELPSADLIPAASGTYQLSSIALGRGRFLLVAIPKMVIAVYKSIFSAADLALDKVELENLALARNWKESPKTLIVDIGGRSTSFTAINKSGLPFFVSHTDFASASVAVDSSLNIKNAIMIEAEAIARKTAMKKIVLSGGKKGAFHVVNGLRKLSF